ncbi:MAG: hypothetical protein PHQ43_00040 [Dehalococcoidales bacterium]|nr:hypothetical protein [Dehalococcoidales bacterium]
MKNPKCWRNHGDGRKVCQFGWCRYKDRSKCPNFSEMTQQEYDEYIGTSDSLKRAEG